MMLAGPVSVQPWEDDERERQREQEDYRNVKIERGKDRDRAGETDAVAEEKRRMGNKNNIEKERGKERSRKRNDRTSESKTSVTVEQRGSISPSSPY